jgi:hypothetical protein
MPFVTNRQPLNLLAADREKLESLRRSRSDEKRRVLHAAILLDCANGMNDSAIAAAHGVNRHSVALCADKFLKFGLEAALGELPRRGKARRIPDDAIAWVLHCSCQKPKGWVTRTNSGPTLYCSGTCVRIASRRVTTA